MLYMGSNKTELDLLGDVDCWSTTTFIFIYVMACYMQSRENKHSRECFSPSKLKKWAIDDYHKTLSWLESQEEKVRTKVLTFFFLLNICFNSL